MLQNRIQLKLKLNKKLLYIDIYIYNKNGR